MVLALDAAAGVALTPHERAHLAWQGDIVAHGGIASGLDSAGTTFGGIVRYTLAEGPQPLAPPPCPLPLVIGDTGIHASTAEVNGRLRAWLEAHPGGADIFPQIGRWRGRPWRLSAAATWSAWGDCWIATRRCWRSSACRRRRSSGWSRRPTTQGRWVPSSPGSGGGGITLALCHEADRARVAAAVEAAGGRTIVTQAGVEGARLEAAPQQ